VVFIARAANTTTLITACTDATAPYACTWKPTTATTYNVYALAIDNDSDTTQSNAVNITFRDVPTAIGAPMVRDLGENPVRIWNLLGRQRNPENK
jgi:hypothetical protein